MGCEDDGLLFSNSSSSSSSSSSEGLLLSAKNNLEVVVGKTTTTTTHKRKTGRKKFKETRHPVYRGVRKKNGSKWVSEVREPNSKKSRIWLGTFPTPEMAARAHDVAVLALRGGGDSAAAALNFADSASRLPRPQSSSAADIQIAAFLAAEAFRPLPSQDTPPPLINISSSSSSSSSRMFVDEEAMFNMPVLINSMAEGLLLTPPAMKKGFQWNDMEDDDFEFISSLWKEN